MRTLDCFGSVARACGRCAAVIRSVAALPPDIEFVYVSRATDSGLCAPASDARPNDRLLSLCVSSPVGAGWQQPLRCCHLRNVRDRLLRVGHRRRERKRRDAATNAFLPSERYEPLASLQRRATHTTLRVSKLRASVPAAPEWASKLTFRHS